MALTPEQQAILLKSKSFQELSGIAPKSPETLSADFDETNVRSQFEDLRRQTVKPETPVITPIVPVEEKKKGFISGVKGEVSEFFQKGKETRGRLKAGEQGLLSTSLQGLGQGAGLLTGVAGEALSVVGSKMLESPVGKVVKRGVEATIKPVAVDILSTPAGQSGLNAIKGGIEAYGAWKEENPTEAANLEAILNIGAILPIGKATQVGVKTVEKSAVGDFLGQAKKELITEPLEKRVVSKAEDIATEALTPVLKKSERLKAFKEGRGFESPILKEIGIESPKDVKDLAIRLKDTLRSRNPIKNINLLGKEIKKTEDKIKSVLSKDNTPIIKQALNDSVETLKKTIPLGFKSEVTMRNQYDNAIDLFKNIFGKSEPTIAGLRKARTLFDQKFKKEFPNALKDGFVDLKSPAGAAYKAVRDHANDYLYQTAKEGKKIKDLISKEADIFRATEIISKQADKIQGTSAIKRMWDKHPLLRYGATVAGGYLGVSAFKEFVD